MLLNYHLNILGVMERLQSLNIFQEHYTKYCQI